jgi:hypothetical protein
VLRGRAVAQSELSSPTPSNRWAGWRFPRFRSSRGGLRHDADRWCSTLMGAFTTSAIRFPTARVKPVSEPGHLPENLKGRHKMSHYLKRAIAVAARAAAIAVGGAAIADASSSSSTTSTTSTATATPAVPQFNGPAHGTAAHEDAEKAVTGTAAASAKFRGNQVRRQRYRRYRHVRLHRVRLRSHRH